METILCTLTDVSGQSTQGEAQLATLSTGERLRRGLKRGAIVFAIGLVFLPVPGLHWVPLLFIFITGYYFVQVAREPKLIRHAEGECPTCKKHVAFQGPINATESKEICPECRSVLKLHPASRRVV